MARVELVPEVADDIERILDHLEHDAATPHLRIQQIIAAIDVLEQNPLIGRPTSNAMRELVIGTDAHGYVALYTYLPEVDIVFVLAIRGQREVGYHI
jgi:plasmid stabilization system protein ParE